MREMHASNQTFSLSQYCKDGLTKHNQHNNMSAWWSSDVFFVTILQGLVYKTQPTQQHERDACEQSDVFFVTMLQGWAYKTQPTQQHERCMRAIRRFLCNNFMLPKRRFWKAEPTFQSPCWTACSKNFIVPKRRLMRFSSFVHSSKIFVWEQGNTRLRNVRCRQSIATNHSNVSTRLLSKSSSLIP